MQHTNTAENALPPPPPPPEDTAQNSRPQHPLQHSGGHDTQPQLGSLRIIICCNALTAELTAGGGGSGSGGGGGGEGRMNLSIGQVFISSSFLLFFFLCLFCFIF
ncbi:hypothetical protein E2C01_053224 [Portunus trituberculatus]|uniref:Uncharacterized protein n=1 Tax=Portunus trituberculatus TaxID=210409 RepID=A0A5B7GQ76_PORTR|nr:hypothetical protein [Portunus trituberculatus]